MLLVIFYCFYSCNLSHFRTHMHVQLCHIIMSTCLHLSLYLFYLEVAVDKYIPMHIKYINKLFLIIIAVWPRVKFEKEKQNNLIFVFVECAIVNPQLIFFPLCIRFWPEKIDIEYYPAHKTSWTKQAHYKTGGRKVLSPLFIGQRTLKTRSHQVCLFWRLPLMAMAALINLIGLEVFFRKKKNRLMIVIYTINAFRHKNSR